MRERAIPISVGFLLLVPLLFAGSGCNGDEEATPADESALEVAAPDEIPELMDPLVGLSRDAKIDTYESLRADLDNPPQAADGGGRAWLIADPGDLPVASPQRLEILYEAGPLGVARGGAVFLQPSPFWDWDPPQAFALEAPGYTEVLDVPEGIRVELDDRVEGMLAVWIDGRKLEAGERLRFVYGAGPAGARIDRYAEAQTPIYLAVDGDGDGIRKLIAEPPRVDIIGAEAAEIRVLLPSTAESGATLRMTLSALDFGLNPSALETGSIVFDALPEGLTGPKEVPLGGPWGSQRSVEIQVDKPGIYRLEARGRGQLEGLTARSNPLLVREGFPRLLWGDLHGHSQLSDGTGTPEQYFDYARRISKLDVAALTDHDHWGMESLDAHPEFWNEIRAAVAGAHAPGSFVSLLGYEWTSWLHGHRHVLYFGDEGEIFSSLDPRYETPPALWDALRGQEALTFAHHSAGGPISTNWLYPPDPELEPLTEIVSVHGSSEAADSPGPIYNPVPGNFVRDALDAGYPLGFIGSGDSHDGHPGIWPQPGGGGLAGIYAEEVSRDSVLAALRARRVYATNGARILLRVELDGQPMGSMLKGPRKNAVAGDDGQPRQDQELEIEIVATAAIERVDLIRSGRISSLPGEGRLAWQLRRSIPALQPGEYHYVRVVQENGGGAWSSPILAR